MDTIPNDIINEIMSNAFTTKDIFNLMQTCTRFKSLDNPKIFQNYYRYNYLQEDNIELYDMLNKHVNMSSDCPSYIWKRICLHHDINIKDILLHINDRKYNQYNNDTTVRCINNNSNYLYEDYNDHYLFNNILKYCNRKGINKYEIIACHTLFHKATTIGNMMYICKDGNVMNKKMYRGNFVSTILVIDDGFYNECSQNINSEYYTLIFIILNLVINLYFRPPSI
ncbi:F-box domain-containing protein [Orpheovirus IHUMI-LCC2]|uniref:F-box domain-containing protein n=1 Tax=Orpheovirus IHUMI-LCC2 TaxID=2023057 RepID=A0A2I2L668_9VIRU|nr:F-box domain-containing protein [Orpheovirus IHUMI-LCC2]SNW63045.1 F-box domain-containing protein [Orpheovirus IHUMI-LCC2]